MTKKLGFKDIEREIEFEFCDFDRKIIFGKQKVVAELMNTFSAKQFNLFKKYLAYEKKIETASCKSLIIKFIKAILENKDNFEINKKR